MENYCELLAKLIETICVYAFMIFVVYVLYKLFGSIIEMIDSALKNCLKNRQFEKELNHHKKMKEVSKAEKLLVEINTNLKPIDKNEKQEERLRYLIDQLKENKKVNLNNIAEHLINLNNTKNESKDA